MWKLNVPAVVNWPISTRLAPFSSGPFCGGSSEYEPVVENTLPLAVTASRLAPVMPTVLGSIDVPGT